MKRLICKSKKIINSNKGESIIESVTALLVLSILLISITMMIQTSLKMTGSSIQNANETQEKDINPLMVSEYNSSEEISITFTAAGIEAGHKVIFNKDNEIRAFAPLEADK